MSSSDRKKSASGKPKHERRRAQRFPVLETFSLFGVIPKKGPYRLRIHDLSEIGVRFDLDIENEVAPLELKVDEVLEFHFYLNQSLYLPLRIKIVRTLVEKKIRIVGAEFSDLKLPEQNAVTHFAKMLEALSDVGVLTTEIGNEP